ncbi:MAG TPA: carboxymuconolactone decarboxylase family protein [Polyangiaceae bacterium]|nr:carboxymuconolactone decarboxylase family protein [Polyangiaceae bacterium]
MSTSNTPVPLWNDSVAELVAIAAAIASNCEPCFKLHYDRARKLGVPREDLVRAVTLAQKVKEAPAKAVLDLAVRHLEPPGTKAPPCCCDAPEDGVKPTPVAKTSKPKCC